MWTRGEMLRDLIVRSSAEPFRGRKTWIWIEESVVGGKHGKFGEDLDLKLGQGVMCDAPKLVK